MKRRGPRSRRKRIVEKMLFEAGIAVLLAGILFIAMLLYCRLAGPLEIVWRG